MSLNFLPRSVKLILKTRIGLLQTGNGIASLTSRSLMKRLKIMSLILTKEFKIKKEIEYFLLNFKTGNGSLQTEKGIIFPTSRPLITTPLLQNVSHFYQGVQN